MIRLRFSKTYIAAFLYRFALLLFIPFVQAVLFANQGIVRLVSVYGADMAVLTFLCSAAAVRWRKGAVIAGKGRISVEKGALLRTTDTTAFDTMGSLMFSAGLFLRLSAAAKIKIAVGVGSISAYLRQEDCKKLFAAFVPKEKKEAEFASGFFRTLLMSATFSNSLTGLLAAAPFLRRAAAVIGAGQTAALIQGVGLEGLLEYAGISPLLSTISSAFILSWLIGFVTEFFREIGLNLSIFSTYMKVSKGGVTKTEVVFRKDSVAAVEMRQSLLLFLAGLYSARVIINSPSAGRLHVLSAATKERCHRLTSAVFGKGGEDSFFLRPNINGFVGYTWLPFLCLSLFIFGKILVPEFFSYYLLSGFMNVGAFVSLLWFVFRIIAFYRSCILAGENLVLVKWFSRLNFTSVVFDKSKVSAIEISQSIFQKRKGTCNIKITLKLKRAYRVRIKHIDFKKAQRAVLLISP